MVYLDIRSITTVSGPHPSVSICTPQHAVSQTLNLSPKHRLLSSHTLPPCAPRRVDRPPLCSKVDLVH